MTLRPAETAPAAPQAQVWPLAPLQNGLLYHAVAGEGGLDVYTMQSTYSFAPGTDLDVLRRACASLLDRHAALRAGFSAALLDRPVQFVPHRVSLPWRVVDLSSLAPEEVSHSLALLQSQERQQRFDMDAPPLFRFVAVDAGAAGCHLVVTNHHIVLDGWSDAMLVVELLEHVAAGGRDLTLPPAPQFDSYLSWLATRDPATDRAAWRSALAGLEAGCTLDPDALGGDREAVLPAVIETELGEQLTARVAETARACGVSTSTVYATVWALVLRSLIGTDDTVFGTTVSGRPAELDRVEAMVGLFLNTVPQRIRILPHERRSDLLRRVQTEQAALLEHHHVGLAGIQQDAGIGPLFDTLYVMRNTPADDEAFARLADRVGLRDIDGGDATHFPATFVVHPDASTRLILAHRSDVLDAEAARDVLDRAVRLLRALVTDPDAEVGALQGFPDQRRQEIVSSWQGERHPLPEAGLVATLEATALRHPDRTALVDGDRRLSFDELWTAVRDRAAGLRAEGVGAGDLVTVELPRGADVVVAIFAVLAAGAAYVPLDLLLPPARLDELRGAVRPAARITPDSYRELADPGRQGHWAATCRRRSTAADLHPHYRHDDLAYVMFTSGSTGRPKGVSIDHGGLVNMLANHQRRIFAPAGAGPERPWRVAHAISFAFDMSWEELLWLLDGHEVHLLDESLRRDAAEMTSYIDRAGIDVINVTPSVASALLGCGLLDADRHVPALVLLGGEAVGADVWSALREDPRTTGYNLYGPTEYTINTLGGGTAESGAPIVGRAIDNTDIRILDSSLEPVADGVPGELYVTGVGLARGYHDSPRLTAERFVADPYGPPGSRMYRTGDVVSRRPGGRHDAAGTAGLLDFHGRTDSQVKIRGHRVEPGEVQAVLARDPRVARCAVVVRTGPAGPVLVGYVVPERTTAGHPLADASAGGGAIDPEAIRTALREHLPEAMVPTAIVAVDDLPLTPNSKLDVAALPEPEYAAGTGRGPRGPVEETICAVFAEVLGLPRVGAEDNFYALGGDSLLAMRAVALLGERLGSRVGVGRLLTAPSPAALAGQLATGTERDPFATVLPLGGRPGRGLPPVLCVHPMTGLGWTYSSLAARLPGSPAVYAVQSPALRSDPAALGAATLPELADLVIAQARTACAEAGDDVAELGVHLIGWSFGGALAHVMAARLADAGIAVHSLTLLDPDPPADPEPGTAAAQAVPQASIESQDDFEQGDHEQAVLEFLIAASLREVPEDLSPPYPAQEVLDWLTEGTGSLSGVGSDDLAALVRASRYNDDLLERGGHRPVPVPTRLVVATGDPQPDALSPDDAHDLLTAAWSRWCTGDLRTTAIEIPHHQLTSPWASERIVEFIAPLLTPAPAASSDAPTTASTLMETR